VSYAPGLELRRRRELGELFGDALSVYGRHLGLFLALAAAVAVPAALIVSGIGLEQLSSPYEEEPALAEALIPTAVSFFVTTPLITAACVYALQDVASGARPAIGETLTRGLEAFAPVFLALLLAALGVAVGLALLIVPGVYLAIRWFFIPQAVVLEGARGAEPLRRSGQVVQGLWWRAFGTVVLANLAAALPGILVIAPLQAAAKATDSQAVSLAGQTAVEVLTTPFLALIATLLWFDLQERRLGAG
jgi:hypothetical protein